MPKEQSLDSQTAIALTALASALVRQSSIDGQKLRMDFLDILEGLCGGPENVGEVGQGAALLMQRFLATDADNPPPV